MRGRELRNQFLTKFFRNRMRIFLSLLFCLILIVPGKAQELNYEVASDNEQHAQIWHRALTWIYSDNNRTVAQNQQQKMPAVSSANLKKFETGLKNASVTGKDSYNFYQLLFLPVARELYKRPNELIDAPLLIKRIVKEAGAKAGRDTVKLKAALTTFVTKTEPKPEEITKPESLATAQVAPPVNTQTSTPETTQVATQETKKSVLFDFNTPMVLSLIALALAAWALLRTFGQKPQAAVSAPRNYSTSSGAEVGSSVNSKNLNAVHKDLKTLRDEIIRLKKENERLLNQMAREIQEVRNAVSANLMQTQNSYQNHTPQPTQFQESTQSQAPAQTPIQDLSQPAGYAQNTFDIEDDHLIMETENAEPIVAESDFTKYARVPEDSVIKDRDLHTDRNDNWSFIEVSVSDPNVQTARFRINPHINHALAINNSLDRLENAFDFPRTANKATNIINQTDGELIRVPQGWKIEKRAKISLV